MTAPTSVGAATARLLLVRLMMWLRNNGHAHTKSVPDFLAQYATSSDQHPRRSLPAVIIEAMRRARAVWSIVRRSRCVRAIAKLNVLRSHFATLHDELVGLDKQNARENFAPEGSSFSDLGTALLQAIEDVSEKLETEGTSGLQLRRRRGRPSSLNAGLDDVARAIRDLCATTRDVGTSLTYAVHDSATSLGESVRSAGIAVLAALTRAGAANADMSWP